MPVEIGRFIVKVSIAGRVVWMIAIAEVLIMASAGMAMADEGTPMELLAKESEWRYVTAAPGDDWRQPDYDDQAWDVGTAGFGRAGTPGGTVNTAWETREIWLRTAFALDSATLERVRAHGTLYLSIAHDDDVEVYLNGERVYTATGYVTGPKTAALGAESVRALRAGHNVLAVHCRQDFGGQFIDLSMVDRLREHFAVTARQMTNTPVSGLLYSHFIELGYGIQVEPMWGEMLFNRSFEPFFPYEAINVEWYDLWNDPNDHGKGYKTDWRGEDWYHSGYEHNAWFACPGDEGPFHIDAKSTFIIERSPVLNVEVHPVAGGTGHGVQALRLTNHETEHWGGVAQEGKYLRKGQRYRFTGRMRSLGTPVNAEVRFYAEGDWDQPLAVFPIGQVGGIYSEKTCNFDNRDFEGRATFSVWFPPGAGVELDCFSLVLEDTVHGWRPDVVEALKRINPKLIRFPGGCFASFYDWREAIGPYAYRTPRRSYFWGGYNYNDVGVAEYAMLCKELGAEMMYCVNLYHPLKQHYSHHFGDHGYGPMADEFPQFTDIEQGARDMADLVAYCNLPADAHPMAKLRARHGYEEPFGVQFWEMDNEVHRWFSPAEYAHAVVVYAKAMKAVDPSIRIGLVTYGGRPGEAGYAAQLPEMLAISGRYVDFLADRGGSEEHLDGMLAHLRTYNAANGTAIRYCNTEWLAYEGAPDDLNRYEYEGNVTKSFMFSKWYYAMNAAKQLLAWQRRGSELIFINFNNLANTHSQCVIDTPKEGVLVTAAGRVFELLSRSPAAWPLAIDGYRAHADQNYQIQAAWDASRERLVLFVVNRTPEARVAEFGLTALERGFHSATCTRLSAESPLVMNTMERPDAIRREDWEEGALAAPDQYRMEVPPFSFTQVVLQ